MVITKRKYKNFFKELITPPVEAVKYDLLEDDEKYFFDERAGIYEYMGGLSRDEAERLAYKDLLNHKEKL